MIEDLLFAQHSAQDAGSLSPRDQMLKLASGGRRPCLGDNCSSPVCLVQHTSYFAPHSITLTGRSQSVIGCCMAILILDTVDALRT
jgi:hypothetical protein